MSGHIIPEDRHGLWIAATFILALLAFSLSLIAYKRMQEVFLGTQLQALTIAQRLDALEKKTETTAATTPQKASETNTAAAATETSNSAPAH